MGIERNYFDVFGPIKFALLALSIHHFSFEKFTVWKDQDSFAFHLAPNESALILSFICKYDCPFPLKSIVSKRTMILKIVIFKDSLLPASVLKLSFERVVISILFPEPMKVFILKLSLVERVVVFYG